MVQQNDCSLNDTLTFSFTARIILLPVINPKCKGEVWTKRDGAGNAGRLEIVTFWPSTGTQDPAEARELFRAGSYWGKGYWELSLPLIHSPSKY